MKKAVEYINNIDNTQYKYAIILGSGWNNVTESMDVKHTIEYKDIPGFLECTVAGHSGKMLLGQISGKDVILLVGRFHIYEGYTAQQVTTPITLLHHLGVETLIVTNASGGINKRYKPGDIMIITDHINNTYQNALIGVQATEDYPIFIDMSTVYDKSYITTTAKICKELNIRAHKGTFMQTIGPVYETPAEVKAYRKWGADAVSMSTVPETTLAHYYKMRVLGLSFIANQATGLSKSKLTHQEVLQNANINKQKLSKLLENIIKEI